jgi:endonuclease/exonuclease/phosphatase family metal-dependent hydrolase
MSDKVEERPSIWTADAPATGRVGQVRVLSYNVLLPNPEASPSGVGWWVYKYYRPQTEEAARTWGHRRALLEERLLGMGSDVICLQEVVEEGFEEDFGFLTARGYAHALHKKGMLRCATFWRADAWALEGPVRHGDKTLSVALRPVDGAGAGVEGGFAGGVYVINCHLTAGPDPARRARQVTQALEQAKKDLVRLGCAPERAPVVVCGDFNCDPQDGAAHRLLTVGEVRAGETEEGVEVFPGGHAPKTQPFGVFTDSYARAYEAAGQQPPPTLIVQRLLEWLVEGEPQALTAGLIAALTAMFIKFAGAREGAVMDGAAIDRWITEINRAPRRGSEWAKARALLDERAQPALSLADFIAIYEAEVREGKPWAVYHDLHTCGVAHHVGVPAVEPPFAARYDCIYCAASLRVEAVRAPLTEAQRQRVYEAGETLPNAWHPSDHLPVEATLSWGARGKPRSE